MRKVEDKFNITDFERLFLPVNPITKKLLPINCEDGVLIAIFSTKEKYEECEGFQTAFCQEIIDCKKFFDYLTETKTKFNFHLVLDPHIVEGKLRFQLIPLDKSDMDVIKKS